MKKSSIIIILLACIVVLLGGYIVYDKTIKKDDTKNGITQCNCPNIRCDCPSCSCNRTIINSLKEIDFTLTDKNQTIKVGDKEVKIRKANENLYINDKVYYKEYFNPNEVYVTDQFILFTVIGECQQTIDSAFDKNGDKIEVESLYQIYDLQLKDGILYAKGMTCSGEPYPTDDVIIKYIDHTLIVTKVN